VISFYRLWAAPSDNELMLEAIPQKWIRVHNIPSDPFTLFLKHWYPQTERFDILTILYFWGMARFFGGNEDIWRLVGTLFASLAIGYFYLISIRLRISRVVSWFLGLSLFFVPIGWLRGIEAEIRAVFFLMLALHFALSSGQWRNSILSALAMLAAVLTKETFLGSWILIPAMILFHEWTDSKAPRLLVFPRLIKQLIPHFVAGILIIAFVLFLRFSIPVEVSYVFQSSFEPIPLSQFVSEYIKALRPSLTFGNLIPWRKTILLLLLVGMGIWFFYRPGFMRWFQSWDVRIAFVVIGLIFAIIFHAVPFYITSRSIEGRYTAPAIMYIALLLGLVITPFFRIIVTLFQRHVSSYFYSFFTPREVCSYATNGLLLILTGIAVIGPFDANLIDSMQYRTDMQAWQALNDLVIETAPQGAHLIATFPSASMGEIDGLYANTLLSDRYDLTYHVGDFSESVCMKMPENCRSYSEFNEMQPPLPQDNNTVIIYLNVTRGESSQVLNQQPTSLREGLRLFMFSPIRFLRTRYTEGFNPYIEYSISSR